LPTPTAGCSQVKWGDDQDTIVARTDDPPRVVIYDVSRTTSGGDVVATGTPPVVLLTERTSASLPFAQPPTVTSVNWSDVVSYTQRLGGFTVTTAAVWDGRTARRPGFYGS